MKFSSTHHERFEYQKLESWQIIFTNERIACKLTDLILSNECGSEAGVQCSW